MYSRMDFVTLLGNRWMGGWNWLIAIALELHCRSERIERTDEGVVGKCLIDASKA